MPDYETEIIELNRELRHQAQSVEMAMEVLENTIESTGNFREGFYSMKKCRTLCKTLLKQTESFGGFDHPDAMIREAQAIIQNFKNVGATIIEEIERIEK